MKVAILHHDLEYSEKRMKELLEDRFDVKMVDIKNPNFKDFKNYSFVLNRVYASVANRDYLSTQNTLNLLKDLEAKNVFCINSYHATKVDYDKKYAMDLREKNGLFVPKTEYLVDLEQALRFAENIKFPLILKRNTGGRGEDLHKIENKKKLKGILGKINLSQDQYVVNGGKYILQEFLEPSEQHDARIGVLDGQILFHYGRTLVKGTNEGDNWLASVSNGSKVIDFKLTKELKDLALKATKMVGAHYNEIDITFTNKGPIIIEDNPTPNYKNIEENIPIFIDKLLESFFRRDKK